MEEILEETVLSNDGTTIGYKVTGVGPGLLIIHGGFRAAKHYVKLGKALSGDFTVYIMDRRGRGQSGPQGNQYSMGKEVEDARAIIDKHHIEFVFGHSYGGLVGLNLSVVTPLKKLALFEPGISANNNMPLKWFPKFEKQLDRQDYTGAMISLIKGLGMGGVMNYLPDFFLKFVFSILSKQNKDWETDKMLLYPFKNEVNIGIIQDGKIDNHKEVNIPVLLLGGSKSPKMVIG